MCRVEEECDKVADTLRLGVEIIDDIDKNEELVQVGPTKIEWTLQNMANKLACAPARTPRREGRQRRIPRRAPFSFLSVRNSQGSGRDVPGSG